MLRVVCLLAAWWWSSNVLIRQLSPYLVGQLHSMGGDYLERYTLLLVTSMMGMFWLSLLGYECIVYVTGEVLGIVVRLRSGKKEELKTPLGDLVEVSSEQ